MREVMDTEAVRAEITAMTPARRRALVRLCNDTLLRQLLPPPPTPEQAGNAERILALLKEAGEEV